MSHSTSCEATWIYQFITNNHASVHLWWKEIWSTIKKFSNYYEHDCFQNFIFLFMSLLTALIIKKLSFGWNLFSLHWEFWRFYKKLLVLLFFNIFFQNQIKSLKPFVVTFKINLNGSYQIKPYILFDTTIDNFCQP